MMRPRHQVLVAGGMIMLALIMLLLALPPAFGGW
jgi:hypothetical protein